MYVSALDPASTIGIAGPYSLVVECSLRKGKVLSSILNVGIYACEAAIAFLAKHMYVFYST